MRYIQIINAVFNQPWAIMPEKLADIAHYIRSRLSWEQIHRAASDGFDAEHIEASKPGRKQSVRGAIGVLPITGVIGPRMHDVETESSGYGTSAERTGLEFDAMVADSSVGAIVLDIDSPGGSVYGIEELGNKIYNARGSKPIVAVANNLAASAAYWIGSQAGEFVVTPSGEVGSIGVFAEHMDISAALEKEGVRPTLVSAGKFKTEGNAYEPLGDAALASIQGRVDDYYGSFLSAVARGRGVKTSAVRGGFGEGRVVGAEQAKELGMVDRIATLDEVLAGLAARQTSSRANAAMADIAIAAMG